MRSILLSLVWLALGGATFAEDPRPGYSDTPLLPYSDWRVHDRDRPYPPVVTPGTVPSDAAVLFDGKDLSKWRAADGSEAPWRVQDGAFEIAPGSGDLWSRDEFGSVQLHIEWATPAASASEPTGQARGNSGVFLMGRYEIQILDSFENATYADGQAGALYGQHPPLVNAARAPGEWQSYDIVFIAPRFREKGDLEAPARVTLFHNGILAHHDAVLHGETTHRALAEYRSHGPEGPIRLQDHGAPVRFRNIWVRPLP